MGSTMPVHALYNYLYIFLPSPAKQQREMTKSYVVWNVNHGGGFFLYSNLAPCYIFRMILEYREIRV